jgi:HEPN domain-containing protein
VTPENPVHYTRTMRAEVRHWLQSAQADRGAAGTLLRARRYSHAVFMAHQAAEKALKAAVLCLTREYPPVSHNLRLLAERTTVPLPPEVATSMLRLAPHYTASRYPDAADGPPELSYNREIARELIRASDEVRKWAERLCSSSEDGEN